MSSPVCTPSRPRHLADLDHAFNEDALIAGDHADAKRRVAELLALVPELRPIDAGRLEAARITEQITALTIGINIRHKATAGIKLVGPSRARPPRRPGRPRPARDGAIVDIVSEWHDGERRVERYRAVAYPTAPAAPPATTPRPTARPTRPPRRGLPHAGVEVDRRAARAAPTGGFRRCP